MSMPLVRVEHLRKEFGAVVAVDGVTLDADGGEVVALVGDNGAGKSTVVNCLAGVYPPTSGRILLDGAAVQFPHPLEARRQGIEAVFQDLALADLQPVYMNMFLGRELVRGPLRRLDREAMSAETQRLLDDLDVRIDSPRKTIRDLSGGQRQAVAITRAVHWAQRLVLMDEPTASLGGGRDATRRRADSAVARPGNGDSPHQPFTQPGVRTRRPNLRSPARQAGRDPHRSTDDGRGDRRDDHRPRLRYVQIRPTPRLPAFQGDTGTCPSLMPVGPHHVGQHVGCCRCGTGRPGGRRSSSA
jgi:simple sugar transport system ATP-binding protein